MTTSLTDFLLARIAEDEANLPGGFVYWYTPERYAVECEAKRRIVEAYIHLAADPELWAHAWTFALQCLALPYAGHPDYDDEWRP